MTKKEQLGSMDNYWYAFNRDLVFILHGVDIYDVEEEDYGIARVLNGDTRTFYFEGDEIISFMTVEHGKVSISVPEKLMENKEIAFYLEETISEFEL